MAVEMLETMTTAAGDGLICAYLLRGRGGGRGLGWSEICVWRPQQGWLHLDRIGSACRRWLHEDSGLDALIRAALLA